MRPAGYILFCCLLLSTDSGFARGLITIADECRLPVIDRWQVAGDSGVFPCEIVHTDLPADFSIHKSGFASSDAVRGPEDLRAAVDGVLERVIYELPEAELLTNSGYYETNVAGFVLEFRSRDLQQELPVYHRLKTAIYTLPDGRQVMYTLWAKASAEAYPAVEPAIKFMQDQFMYMGEHRDDVFARESLWRWQYLALFVGLLALVWVIRRQRMKRAAPPGDLVRRG